jgi:hypothetical protein
MKETEYSELDFFFNKFHRSLTGSIFVWYFGVQEQNFIFITLKFGVLRVLLMQISTKNGEMIVLFSKFNHGTHGPAGTFTHLFGVQNKPTA